MIRRDPFRRATLLTCDALCGSVEEFAEGADLPSVAKAARVFSGWTVEHVYDDHYRCKCLGCLAQARAA